VRENVLKYENKILDPWPFKIFLPESSEWRIGRAGAGIIDGPIGRKLRNLAFSLRISILSFGLGPVTPQIWLLDSWIGHQVALTEDRKKC
jgi:hypothetical protein